MKGIAFEFVRRCLPMGLVAVFGLFSAFPAHAGPPILERLLAPLKRHGHPPRTCEDPAVEELAANLDWLEHNIDRWGSIVAKSPDVWGEARLTKYRREVEKQLADEMDQFDPDRISGASLVRDRALLAAAVGLGAGGATASDASSLIGPATTDTTIISIDSNDDLDDFGLLGENEELFGDGLQLEQTAVLDQHKRYLNHLSELRRINEGDDASDAPGYSINLIRIPVSVLPGTKSDEGYGAEITVNASIPSNEQTLPTLMRDLIINDVVDSLALPMTRFLNSNPRAVDDLLYAFDNQQRGYPDLNRLLESPIVLSEDSELIKELRLLYEKEMGHDSGKAKFLDWQTDALLLKGGVSQSNASDFFREFTFVRRQFELLNDQIQKSGVTEILEATAAIPPGMPAPDPFSLAEDLFDETDAPLIASGPGAPAESTSVYSVKFPLPGYSKLLDQALQSVQAASADSMGSGADDWRLKMAAKVQNDSNIEASIDRLSKTLGSIRAIDQVGQTAGVRDDVNETLNQLELLAQRVGSNVLDVVSNAPMSSSLTRRSRLPIPPTQLIEFYGLESLGHLAVATHRAFRSDLINREIVHLSDVRAFLLEEVASAYQWLEQPSMADLWHPGSSDVGVSPAGNPLGALLSDSQAVGLIPAIRTRDRVAIDAHRRFVMDRCGGELSRQSTMTLVWATYAIARLINERLIEDMHHFHLVDSCDSSLAFYGPHPGQRERDLFDAYVAVRWPLRTFTIDPVVTEQNIADSASIYRQMQFAATLAVAGGQLNANAAMRFVRELQRDMATIDVNRTVVGFAHNGDTFGWRFYPRFQVAPVENNATVFFRDLLGGGPTDQQLVRSRQLEPGMRECVAVVLAPSFVDQIDLTTRTNWFRLDKPSHSALSMQELTHQSRSIVQMRRAAESCVRRPDLYRDGELHRLLDRVTQLDRELPLQTLDCRIPESNSLGGFELFSSGTRELGPELFGWYGSPGYDQTKKNQTFYLVGDNFSVHETEAIAGTQMVTSPHLLSRQIIRVTLPEGLPIIPESRLGIDVRSHWKDPSGVPINSYEGFVDVHVATPYGVSNHLLIPVLKNDPAPARPAPAAPKPSLSGGGKVFVPIKETNRVYSVAAPLQTTNEPLFSITVPPHVGLTGDQPATITLNLTNNGQPLPPVQWEDVVATGGTYRIGLPQLIPAIEKSGVLTKSVGGYVAWLINTAVANQKPVSDIIDKELNVKVNAKISVGGGPAVTVSGEGDLVVVATM